MSKIKDDLGLLFTSLTTIVGLWYFLLIYIIELSKNDPANYDLLVLGQIHMLVFVLLFINLTLMFIIGLESIHPDNHPFKKILSIKFRLKQLLFSLWYPIILLSVINIIINRFLSLFEVYFKIAHTLELLLSLIFLYFFIEWKVMNFNRTYKGVMMVIFTLPLGFIYIIMMSFLFCDVEIKSDKEIYEVNEKAHFIIKHKGYILNPRIESVEFCFYPVISKDSAQTRFIEMVSVDLATAPFINKGAENLLSIKFSGQLFSTERVKYYPIYIK